MNDKVYIITKGRYSDYHICAVTLDKDRAERLRKMFDTRYEDARVEEYILDETNEGESLYIVEFSDDAPPRITRDEYDGFGALEDCPCVAYWLDPVCVYVRAKDAQRAMKIACDEYARWKAEKEGIS